MPSARESASIRCWLPMCPWKSPRPSARPRCATASHHTSVRPPNADDDLLRQIASYGRVTHPSVGGAAGVTGAENRAALPLNHLVAKLSEYNAAPPLQGFGISAPDQVKAAIDAIKWLPWE